MSGILHKLAVMHGTDKARHGYCDFYEQVFGPSRDRVARVLEIGVKDGASLRMWLDYFPNAHVYGLEDGNTGDPSLWPRGERVTIFAGDQGRVPDLWNVALRVGGPLDIIIDDGGHTMWQQQLSFAALWPSLRLGGFYVIEDTHTTRLEGFGAADAPETTEAMLGRLQHELGFGIVSYAGTERDATAIILKPRTPADMVVIAGRMIFEATCDICGEFNGPSWQPGGPTAWAQLPEQEREGWTVIGAKVLEAGRGNL